MAGDPSIVEGETAAEDNVAVAEATMNEAALPERVQEALGPLAGAAREGPPATPFGDEGTVGGELLDPRLEDNLLRFSPAEIRVWLDEPGGEPTRATVTCTGYGGIVGAILEAAGNPEQESGSA